MLCLAPAQHEMEPKAGSKRRDKDEGDREKCFQCKRDARKGDAMVYCEVCQWGEWLLRLAPRQ